MAPRWCSKCKVVFGGHTCPGGHATFMYSSRIPAAAKPQPGQRMDGEDGDDDAGLWARLQYRCELRPDAKLDFAAFQDQARLAALAPGDRRARVTRRCGSLRLL